MGRSIPHDCRRKYVLTGRAAAVPSRTLALYRRKMHANGKRLTAALTDIGMPNMTGWVAACSEAKIP